MCKGLMISVGGKKADSHLFEDILVHCGEDGIFSLCKSIHFDGY